MALFVTELERDLGTVNGGLVYGVIEYDAMNDDELSFKLNEPLTILRRGDGDESKWWWARAQDGTEGYVPRTYLGVRERSNVPAYNCWCLLVVGFFLLLRQSRSTCL